MVPCLHLERPRPQASSTHARLFLVLNPKWITYHYSAIFRSSQHYIMKQLHMIVLFSVRVPLCRREVTTQDPAQIWG